MAFIHSCVWRSLHSLLAMAGQVFSTHTVFAFPSPTYQVTWLPSTWSQSCSLCTPTHQWTCSVLTLQQKHVSFLIPLFRGILASDFPSPLVLRLTFFVSSPFLTISIHLRSVLDYLSCSLCTWHLHGFKSGSYVNVTNVKLSCKASLWTQVLYINYQIDVSTYCASCAAHSSLNSTSNLL